MSVDPRAISHPLVHGFFRIPNQASIIANTRAFTSAGLKLNHEIHDNRRLEATSTFGLNSK